jgi:hypothetical protein
MSANDKQRLEQNKRDILVRIVESERIARFWKLQLKSVEEALKG